MGETLPQNETVSETATKKAAREAIRRSMQPLDTGYAERHGEDKPAKDDTDPNGLSFSA